MAIYDVTVSVRDNDDARPSQWADLRLTIEPDKVHNVAAVMDTVERFMHHCARSDKDFRIVITGELLRGLPPPKGQY